MFVKVIAAFTCWTGEAMIVGNVDDIIELPDNHAENYIDAGMAKKAKAPKGSQSEADAADAGTEPAAEPAAAADAEDNPPA